MPSAGGVLAKLLKGKLAARRRKFEADLESVYVRRGSRRCGTLFAQADNYKTAKAKRRESYFYSTNASS